MVDATDIRAWTQDCPDPNLLPLLARYVPLDSVRYVAQLADITGGRGGPTQPLPIIAEQTARALAARWNEFDEQLARAVLTSLPRTALYLPESDCDQIAASDLVELPVVEACVARVRRDQGRASVLASDYLTKDAYDRPGLSLLAPLLTADQATSTINLVLNDDSALRTCGWMDLAGDDLLTGPDVHSILQAMQPEASESPLIAAATLAPLIDDGDRPALLAAFDNIALEGLYLPDWLIAAMLVRVAPWLNTSARQKWTAALDEPYRGHIARYLDELPAETPASDRSDTDDLLLSHPAGIEIRNRLDALPADEAALLAAQAVADILDKWAGAPPMASAPIAPAQPAVPVRRRRRRSFRGAPTRGAPRDEPDDDAAVPMDDMPLDHSPRAAPSDEPAPPTERFPQAAIIHDQIRRRTFVAGARNEVVCWIGPEDMSDPRPRATADQPIDEESVPEEGLELDVILTYGDQESTGKIWLPKDARLRTGDCILLIDVPADERFVVADVAFLFQGRAFEIVRIDAPVLEPGEDEPGGTLLRVRTQAQRREVINLTEREPIDATAVSSDSGLVVFGARGSRHFKLQNTDAAIQWLNDELFETDKSLVRGRTDADDENPMIDPDDAETLAFLRDMAIHGNSLYKELLEQGFKDPGERIQLLNLEATAYVPLEFVYDRGFPIDGAKLCDGWAEALAGDASHCPSCKPAEDLTLEERDAMPTICPLGFWSLQKVIERIDKPRDEEASDTSSPRDGDTVLPAITSALFASSDRVDQSDRDNTFNVLGDNFDNALRVDNWNAWKNHVRQDRPQLFVALPHHSVAGAMDALEIGHGDELSQSRMSRLYVTSSTDQPGPVVVLFGCETQKQGEMGYVSFAREFTRHRAAIVVGTMARVLGRHAAPVAQCLIEDLAQIGDQERFGPLMRRLRRRMLARGYLMAFCLVALGDGDWRLTPKSQE